MNAAHNHLNERKRNSITFNVVFHWIYPLSSEIAMEQEKSFRKAQRALEMLSLVDEAENVLESKHGDLDEFGRLSTTLAAQAWD